MKSEYATIEDFRELFTEGVSSLYLLSFLLTANHEKAERCFVTGLGGRSMPLLENGSALDCELLKCLWPLG